MNNLKSTQLIILFFLLCVTNYSIGQEIDNDKFKFGIGVSLFNITEYSYESDYDPVNSIHFIGDFGDKFRLESVVGFALSNDENLYSIGIGAFGKKAISNFDILYGIRLAINSFDTKIVAPTLGGEYYFIKNFSIGSEVQVRGLFKEDEWIIVSNSSVIFRFYF